MYTKCFYVHSNSYYHITLFLIYLSIIISRILYIKLNRNAVNVCILTVFTFVFCYQYEIIKLWVRLTEKPIAHYCNIMLKLITNQPVIVIIKLLVHLTITIYSIANRWMYFRTQLLIVVQYIVKTAQFS